MPFSCAAHGCSQTKASRRITFHRFPCINKVLLEKWLIVLGRKKEQSKGVEYLCSRHFRPHDFVSRKKLKRNAIPSVFDVLPPPRVVCQRMEVISEASMITQPGLSYHEPESQSIKQETEPTMQDPLKIEPASQCIKQETELIVQDTLETEEHKVDVKKHSLYLRDSEEMILNAERSVRTYTCITHDFHKVLLISQKLKTLLSANKQEEVIELLRKEKEYLLAITNKIKRHTDEVNVCVETSLPEAMNSPEHETEVMANEIKVEADGSDTDTESAGSVGMEADDDRTDDESDTSEADASMRASRCEVYKKLWRYKCRTCWKKFHSRSAFILHFMDHNLIFPYKCELCTDTFMQKFDLAEHYRRHVELYKCLRCLRVFNDRDKIGDHFPQHVIEYPYKCEICHYVCEKESKLAKHYETHSNDEPYSCGICHEAFSHSSYLVVHYRMHPGYRPHECVICKKCFANTSLLMKHSHVHKNKEPYRCEVCCSYFSCHDDLLAHCRVHSDSYPYECNVCLQTFETKQHADFHGRVHEGGGPFECSLCGLKLRTEHHYSLHYMRKHFT